MVRYEHRQTGKLMAVAALLALMITAAAVIGGGEHWLALVVGLVVASALLLLGRLTVRVTDTEVTHWFGPGIFRRRYRLADIQAVQRVRNPWTWGWGIRLFPGGTLYNVSGLDAVEFRLPDGKRIRLGTDRPADLERAIETARSRPAPPP